MAYLDEDQDQTHAAASIGATVPDPKQPPDPMQGMDPETAQKFKTMKAFLGMLPQPHAAPPPQMPSPADPEIAKTAQDTLTRNAALRSLINMPSHVPTVYSVTHLGARPDVPMPTMDAADAAARLPVQQETARVAASGKQADIYNKWLEAQAGRESRGSIADVAALSKYLGTEASTANAQTRAGATTGAATIKATAPKTKINPITGQPYNENAAPRAGGGDAAPYDKRLEKMLADLRTDLSGVGRGDQRLKQQQQVYDRADRLNALIAKRSTGAGLDRREIEELAIGLNSMLSGSNVGAQAQVKALVPRSALGDAAHLMEWLTSEPQGTNQQEFVKRMAGTVGRERDLAGQKMRQFQYERLPAHVQGFGLFPKQMGALLNSYGIQSKVVNGKLYTQAADGSWEEQ